jgi:nucleotide-binding universal stress UspA family protein
VFPKTIVVPLDGSPFAAKAIPVASAIARPVGGDLLLVTTRWDSDVAEPRDYLARTATGVRDLKVRTLVILDRPVVAAIQVAANEAPGRVVCMTSHGRGRLRWALLGSVAEQVMSESFHPVVLLGRQCETQWPNGLKHMIICIDGSTKTPSVVPIAVEWARELDLDVHLAMAVHPLDTGSAEAVLDVIADQIEAEGLRVHHSVVGSSYPAAALADLADSLDVGLIAMNSHARTGVARFALGSVTMGVVGMARCPVLVVKTP